MRWIAVAFVGGMAACAQGKAGGDHDGGSGAAIGDAEPGQVDATGGGGAEASDDATTPAPESGADGQGGTEGGDATGDDAEASAGEDTGTTGGGSDAEAPESAAPEAAVPEAAPPEASAPEASIPEASVPEASPPEASIPDVASPPPEAGPDASDSGSGTACPSGAGTSMVRVPTAVGSFCIDRTEAQDAEYLQFLAAVPGAGTQPADCAGITSHVPTGGMPANDALPVVNVSWCDAYAYCAWAGKRMCGHVTPFSNVSSWTDATKDEWFAACSEGGVQTYPYGENYVATACDGSDDHVNARVAVGSMAGCVGGYPGILDMSGNVWEWEWSCSQAGLTGICRVRGGAYNSASTALTCAADSNTVLGTGLTRGAKSAQVGIRCCAD